jgi:Fe2+ transport system protein FeoA
MNGSRSTQAGAGDSPNCEICPLSRVEAGVEVRIRKLCASPDIQNRLREIGLREDQIIRLLMSQTSFICQVCSARFAISAKLAQMIMVEPVLQPVRATQSR